MHTFQSASDTAERLIIMTTERDNLLLERDSALNKSKIYNTMLTLLEAEFVTF